MAALSLALSGCHAGQGAVVDAPASAADEIVRVLVPDSGITATIVAPSGLGAKRSVELILYALPNGNSTAETMGRALTDSSVGWRFDIQHIAAQTRALRARGVSRAVVVYLEASGKSWPAWRQARGYDQANARILRVVQALRDTVARMTAASDVRVTLTGHSGGGSFMFGVIEAPTPIPAWVDRIAFLDANYNFAAKHGPVLAAWLFGHPKRRLEVVAYDDREIMLDGKKVVSDSGGTWRASERLIAWFGASAPLVRDTAGVFLRWQSTEQANGKLEILLHPNPENRILHTALIGEMNAYLYTMLVGRDSSVQVLAHPSSPRVYSEFVRMR
ncbi:MAG: hypothetical protein IBJ03_05985 [Gemmatimonadaceae bacterium]|nr:hypothetical protein [Gemmatimonadaceae bacterium]